MRDKESEREKRREVKKMFGGNKSWGKDGRKEKKKRIIKGQK